MPVYYQNILPESFDEYFNAGYLVFDLKVIIHYKLMTPAVFDANPELDRYAVYGLAFPKIENEHLDLIKVFYINNEFKYTTLPSTAAHNLYPILELVENKLLTIEDSIAFVSL